MRRALTGSLLLNGLLLAAVFLAHGLKANKADPARVLPDMTNRQLRVPRSALPPVPSPQIVETNEPFYWSQLESEDYRVYVANLQAIGCPAETIRDIIRADVQELFERKVANLVAVETANFWNLVSDQEALEDTVNKKADALEKLEDERDEMLEALIGSETSGRDVDAEVYEVTRANAAAHLLDYLSPEKLTDVLAIQQRFLELQLRLKTERNAAGASESSQAWVAKVEELHCQEQEALKAALSPADYQEYRLRTAFSSNRLRGLVGFSASEAELKRLTELESSFAGPAGQARAATLRSGRNPSAERLAALEEYLGPDRFAAYERANDTRYSTAHGFVQRAGLEPDAAVRIYELQRDAEERVRQVGNDKTLGAEERQAALSALGQQYRDSLTGLLGENYPRYVRIAGGWLTQF